MEDTQTIQEVAQSLGLSASTIKQWADMLWPGEPLRDAAGRQRLSLEQVRILEILHSLKSDDKGINTITRIIGPIRFGDSAVSLAASPQVELLEDKVQRLQRENQRLKSLLTRPWWRLLLQGKRGLIDSLSRPS